MPIKRKTRLIVTFQAIYQGPEDIQFEYAETTEQLELVIPGLDTKFVVLPKVLEGITDRVISTHNDQISAWLARQIEVNRSNGQLALWNGFRATEPEEPAASQEGASSDNDIELTPDEAAEVYQEFAP